MQMKHYFVLGDINKNTKTTNLNSSNFINMLSSNCSTSIIDIPTRVTCTSSTVLDHIITNENCCVIRPIVIDYSITDHFPIMAILLTENLPLKMLHINLFVLSKTLIQLNITTTCSHSSINFCLNFTL